jgi:galactose mutarotase-like enzyme
MAEVKDSMCLDGKFTDIEEDWYLQDEQLLKLNLHQELDHGFLPINHFDADAFIENHLYKIHLQVSAPNDQLCFQVYRPDDSDFICVEPIGAKNPRNLTETKSSLSIRLEILD